MVGQKIRNWYPNILKIIKIAAGTGLSIGLALAAGLKYSPSAGVITLLSIQNTKKETIEVAVKLYCAIYRIDLKRVK